MSRENVELVRGCYQPRDLGRFFELLDDEVEFDFTAYPVPDAAVIRGRAAAIEWSRRWFGTWDDYTLEAVEIVDAGDRVVVVQHERGRGRGSGVPLDRRWAVVYTLRAGKVVRFQAYRTREDALEAVGPLE
jgi:ketosteroid isomerase-like protein